MQGYTNWMEKTAISQLMQYVTNAEDFLFTTINVLSMGWITVLWLSSIYTLYQVFTTPCICDPHRTWFPGRAWKEENMPHHHTWLPAVLCSCVTHKARQSLDWTRGWSPQQHTCASGSGCLPRRSPDEEDSGWIAGAHGGHSHENYCWTAPDDRRFFFNNETCCSCSI